MRQRGALGYAPGGCAFVELPLDKECRRFKLPGRRIGVARAAGGK
jgi:hypothetical protein